MRPLTTLKAGKDEVDLSASLQPQATPVPVPAVEDLDVVVAWQCQIADNIPHARQILILQSLLHRDQHPSAEVICVQDPSFDPSQMWRREFLMAAFEVLGVTLTFLMAAFEVRSMALTFLMAAFEVRSMALTFLMATFEFLMATLVLLASSVRLNVSDPTRFTGRSLRRPRRNGRPVGSDHSYRHGGGCSPVP
ncbi:hypothetical protein AB0C27_40580 [Nonomuraea sp. NPDC048882]|uniref:hypothetical protein n=1 Tax=Nonomuraea sp. NPDC048882 TaxID=3154347 RepID=UPI00340C6E53